MLKKDNSSNNEDSQRELKHALLMLLPRTKSASSCGIETFKKETASNERKRQAATRLPTFLVTESKR